MPVNRLVSAQTPQVKSIHSRFSCIRIIMNKRVCLRLRLRLLDLTIYRQLSPDAHNHGQYRPEHAFVGRNILVFLENSAFVLVTIVPVTFLQRQAQTVKDNSSTEQFCSFQPLSAAISSSTTVSAASVAVRFVELSSELTPFR